MIQNVTIPLNACEWVSIKLCIYYCHTISQCLSFRPGLQTVVRMGRCCLNLSIFFLKFSVTRPGDVRSEKIFVSLYMVRHMFPSSSDTVSAFSCWNGPWEHMHKTYETHTQNNACIQSQVNLMFNVTGLDALKHLRQKTMPETEKQHSLKRLNLPMSFFIIHIFDCF